MITALGGDDTIVETMSSIENRLFIDGGLDFDTLRLDAGDVDFSKLSNELLANFEAIELNSDNQSITLEPIDITSMTTDNLLILPTDNDGTAVISNAVWNERGTSTLDNINYNVFNSDGASLLVQENIDTSTIF